MAPAGIITLTTDFGISDPYVGAMKGVILGINPRAVIVDISHQVTPQAISEGSFVIGTSYHYFPDGTIHVVVVDPGVGTSRDALLLASPTTYFLAPDNGVLSYVLSDGFGEGSQPPGSSQVELPHGYAGYRLTNAEFWLNPVSSTFHGRDIFAPVAAHLSLGVLPERFGPQVHHVTCSSHRRPEWDGPVLEGEVVHVDRFGNLITNLASEVLPMGAPIAIEIMGNRIEGLSPSYAEGGPLLAIVGSHGNLEVSVRDGSAAALLGAGVGEAITVRILQA